MRSAITLAALSMLVASACGASCSGGGAGPTSTLPEVVRAPLPRTDLRLLVLTDLKGYLEPCGCTSRPLGGIDRMAAQIAQLREDGTPTLLVSAGSLFFDGSSHGGREGGPDPSVQETWKAETLADILSRLGLAAAAPGALDLAEGTATYRALAERAAFPLLAAGATLDAEPSVPAAQGAAAEGDAVPGEAAAPTPMRGHVVVEAGELRVGLVGVSELETPRGPAQGATPPSDAVAAARDAVAAARAEGAAIVVVLATTSRRTARRIATSVAGVDFVVQGELDETEAHPPSVTEGAVLVHAGRQGQGLLVIDIAQGDDDASGRAAWVDASTWTRTAERDRLQEQAEALRARIAEWEADDSVAADDLSAQRARLRDLEAQMTSIVAAPQLGPRAFDARYLELGPEAARDAEISALMAAYDRRVNEYNREAFASFTPRPPAPGQPSFVGSEACRTCHSAVVDWWRTTLHGHAYQTLQERNKEYNLSCVGCHVTGYNQPGGSTVSHVGRLADVGCENCHGPASMHVADPDHAAVDVRRETPESVCVGCHNTEHSDTFVYDAYLRVMMVPGHGLPAPGAAQ